MSLTPLTSPSVDSCPTKCSICCSKQEAGLFQTSALFKGDFIFNVDMYLDFTAKFVSQPLGEVGRLVPDVELCLLSYPPTV